MDLLPKTPGCDDGQPPFWKLRRNRIAFLGCLGFINVYMLRVNLSVGIVAMSVSTDTTTSEFQWSPQLRGAVMSSFFYGYMCTQLLGGVLASKIGGVKLIGYGVLSTAIFTIITPVAARYSVYLVIAVRIVEGVFEGVVFPAMHAVWSKWAPPNESTRLASYTISGNYVGTVIGYPMCGWLAQNYGWPYTFYVPGFIAMIWCAVWLTTVAETPGEDKSITKEELKYIVDSIGPTDKEKISVVNYPWKKMFTSMPVWSIAFATVCENWGFYTLLTQLPTFMHDVLKFDIGKGSLLSALPYSVMAVALQFSGIFIDWLRETNIFTNTQVRKISTCGAFLLQAICMFSAGNCETGVGSLIFLTLTAGLVSFSVTGYCVNPLDIAPQYASIILGIANTFGSIPGIVSPLLTGFIVQHESPEEWQWVFIISSSLYFLGGIFYAIFASGERQSWAEIKTEARDDLADQTLVRNKDIGSLSQFE